MYHPGLQVAESGLCSSEKALACLRVKPFGCSCFLLKQKNQNGRFDVLFYRLIGLEGSCLASAE